MPCVDGAVTIFARQGKKEIGLIHRRMSPVSKLLARRRPGGHEPRDRRPLAKDLRGRGADRDSCLSTGSTVDGQPKGRDSCHTTEPSVDRPSRLRGRYVAQRPPTWPSVRPHGLSSMDGRPSRGRPGTTCGPGASRVHGPSVRVPGPEEPRARHDPFPTTGVHRLAISSCTHSPQYYCGPVVRPMGGPPGEAVSLPPYNAREVHPNDSSPLSTTTDATSSLASSSPAA
jgi:hypothetical protein